MSPLLIGLCLFALGVSSGCTAAHLHEEPDQRVAVHPCTKNSLLRSSGLFGGAQPEIFLSGPGIRREPPPAVDGLTRVLDVTEVDFLGDPGSQPVIDKCSSRVESIDKNEVDVTIIWRDQNCPDSFDDEDQINRRSRVQFKFSRSDLGVEGPDAAIQRLLVVDAYFTQEIQPARRHPATGMPLPERGRMHLVVRVMRAPLMMDPGAATTADVIRRTRSEY